MSRPPLISVLIDNMLKKGARVFYMWPEEEIKSITTIETKWRSADPKVAAELSDLPAARTTKNDNFIIIQTSKSTRVISTSDADKRWTLVKEDGVFLLVQRLDSGWSARD